MSQFGKFRAFPGGGRKEGGVDLDQLEVLRGRMGRFPWRWLLLALVALVFVFTSFYTVDPEEVAVVLRFGRFVGTTESGLHWKIPFGVDRVVKVPVERQLKEEFGFRTADAGVRTRYVEQAFEDESLMLTGDLNIADVSWVVQYRIVDPYKYLFRVRNVRETFRAMSEAVMQEVVGNRTVNEVITLGREELASVVEADLQALAEQYETGLRVEQVVLQNVLPPDAVMPSFNQVNQAEQQRSQLVNTAEARYNQVIPRARGEAEQTVQEAEGYALDRVNRARGEANRFNSVYAEYRRAPEVTRKRLYLETMGVVMPRAGRKLVVDGDIENLTPLLNMETVAVPPATAAAATQGGGG
jgi:membrane protease subunit HflK